MEESFELQRVAEQVSIDQSRCLLDSDLPRLRSLSLRNQDGKNAVLQACLDSLLVHALREAEAAVKLAHRAFANPISVLECFVVLRDLLIALLGDLLSSAALLFNRWLLVFWRSSFYGGIRSFAFLPHCLMPSRDSKCVRISPLDVDVLLVDAWELAMQLVGVIDFLDVEFGSEGLDGPGLLFEFWTEDALIVVVHKTEERSELLREAWEERHFW